MEITANGENQELTCQPSRIDTFSKENIDECKRYVLSIQRRLDKAVANGDKAKIKWYSHILSKKSRAVKVLAVHRVCQENQGKHTAGVDGIAIPKEKQKADIMMHKLLNEIDITKKPNAIRRAYIPKPNGDTRPLGIPTIADRIIQDTIRQSIEPICEFHFANCSYGFRPKRSCQDAMSDLFNKLSTPKAMNWIIEGDIKGCFNNIKHEYIISTLRKWNIGIGTRKIINRMLKAGIMENEVITSNEMGTPQGGIISPMLANVALTTIDNFLEHQYFKQRYSIVRYADDFVITAKTKEEALVTKRIIRDTLKRRIGLDLSEEKTHITEISTGFDFLGFNFRKYGETLWIKPSKTNIQLLKSKVSDTIKGANSALEIVAKLNPVLMGWGNYYRHVVSTETFKHIDNFIWYKLMQWIKYRHPKQGTKYRRRKYFAKEGVRDWQFKDIETDKKLMFLNSIPIKRFIKIRRDKRVYDANAIEYWQQREYINAKNSITAEKTMMALFTKQRGKCEHCGQVITDKDVKNRKIHKHHMKPRSEGGDWKLRNLRLLHADCHNQLHSLYSRKEMADLINKGIDYLRLMKSKPSP